VEVKISKIKILNLKNLKNDINVKNAIKQNLSEYNE